MIKIPIKAAAKRQICAISLLVFMALYCSTACNGQGSTAGGTASGGGTASAMGGGGLSVSSLVVVPSASPTQNVGQTLGLTATATFSDATTQNVTAGAAWTTSNAAIGALVNLSATENVQCISAGTVSFTATFGNVSGSIAVTCVGVLPPTPTPVSLAISPSSPSIPQGQPGGVQYTATETYSDGSTLDVTAGAVFSSASPTIAQVGTLTTTREIDCIGTGTSSITATHDGLTSLATTQTCSAVLSTITVTPASPSVVAGNPLQFIATCGFTDGSSQACAVPTWSSSSAPTATISSSGLAQALAAGTSTIKAQLGSISGTTVLTVTSPVIPPATLSSITVTPASKTVNIGQSLPFIATGTYSDGSTANVSAQATWTTSNAAKATLQLPDGVVGSAYSQTLTGTGATPYTWTVPALASSGQIDILDFATMPLPTRNSTHLVGTSLYKAYHVDAGLLWWIKNTLGYPSDGEVYDGSFFYHWFTEDGDSADQAACIAAGYSSCFLDPFASKMFVTPVKVAPRYFTLGGSDVVVKSPGPNNFVRTTNCGADKQPLINLGNIMGITHDAGNVAWGGSVGTVRTLEIQYYWGIANETTVPPTSGTRERYELAQGFGQVQWDTSHWNGSGWTVDQTTTQVTTSAGGAPTPNFGCKLPAVPIAATLPPGTISTAHPQLNLADNTGVISGTPNTPGTYVFTVQQEDAGGTFHLQPQTIRVNAAASTAQQTVNGIAAGTSTITATVGAVSGNATITVQAPVPTLSSIAVTPPSPAQYNGSSVQFTATGTYSDGSTQNLTTQATWTTGTAAVATIATNTATCVANSGTSVITATVGAVSGTQTLTCQTPTTNTGGNAYCTTGGSWIGPTTDGPAALPTACMNTALSNTPSPGTVHAAVPIASLAATYASSACGDVIQITAGTTVNGPVTLTGKGCDNAHWITIKSTGVASGTFPAEGVRATPCISNVVSMPGRLAYPCSSPSVLTAQIVAPSSNNALILNGADHLRFIGLEPTRTPAPKALIYSLVDLTSNTGTQTNNIIFDRMWFHGIEGTFPQNSSTDTSTTRAVYLGQSNHVAIIDSTISNIYDNGATASNGNTDSQCVSGGVGGKQLSGWGVYKFVNNHAECGSEGFILGGSGGPQNTPPGCALGSTCTLDVPTDIEVRQNHFFAPNFWNCNTTVAIATGCPNRKNGIEFKSGARILIEGNVFENCWYSSQPYCYVMDFAPKNQMSSATSPGTCPSCLVQDAVARYNYGYNYPGIQLAAYSTSFVGGCAGCGQTLGRRLVYRDNLVGDKLNTGAVTGVSGYDCVELGQSAGPMTNIVISHNTCVNAQRAMFVFGGQMDNITIQNNLMPTGNYSAVSFTGGGCDKAGASFYAMLTACVNGTSTTWTADHNGVFGWSTATLGGTLGRGWPTNGSGAGNTFFSGTSGVGFTSYATDSGFNPAAFQLTASSPLHNAASDGKDVGADIVTLQLKIAGVRQ